MSDTSQAMSYGPHKGVIFLADDDADFSASLQDALEDAGYLVVPARSGTEALNHMRGFSGAALAIIDLTMPCMDGWALISALRGDKELYSVPIIVISSHRLDQIKGADRFLRKPVVLKDLLQIVEELLD